MPLARIMGLILATISVSAFAQNPSSVHVFIDGLRSSQGKVSFALHNRADSFPSRPLNALARKHSPITEGKSEARFEGIAPGEYAIAVYHDENNNNTLDSNFIGIPKEGVGASNNARGRMGPPTFEDAKFQLNGQALQLNIKIRY